MPTEIVSNGAFMFKGVLVRRQVSDQADGEGLVPGTVYNLR